MFSNGRSNDAWEVDSYIYWGSEGGYRESDRSGLPTLNAKQNTMADLDGDGWLDIVFSNHRDSAGFAVDSYIYWGSAEGFSEASRSGLATYAAHGHVVADLDGDGWLDVLFNSDYDGEVYLETSTIFWGMGERTFAEETTELASRAALGVGGADLDMDGFPDLVIANNGDADSTYADSYVYWGAATGFDEADMAELPTIGAHGTALADLDHDGWLDIVFANCSDRSTNELDSWIYWGSTSGYSTANRDGLPTVGAYGVSAADLDGDGWDDLVFSNYSDGETQQLDSWIYWGSAAGFSDVNRTDLPTVAAVGNSVSDLDGDGWLDIVFACANDGSGSGAGHETDSLVYWGSETGFSTSRTTRLPTLGSAAVSTHPLEQGY